MLTISRQRLLLECSHCGQSKLIDVAIADDGMMGIAKCDACKTDELRVASVMRPPPRRPLRRLEPVVTLVEPVDPEWIATGEVLRRVRSALGELGAVVSGSS
jgi:NAD-dependent SIR2 family protein deacetylase